MSLAVLIYVFACSVVLVIAARYAKRQLGLKLKQAGIKLSCDSISYTSARRIDLSLSKGPLRQLSVDSITWGSAARAHRISNDASSNSSSAQGTAARLPIQIMGLRLVLGQQRNSSSRIAANGPASAVRLGGRPRSSATWPIARIALAVARRLLPNVPVRLQDAAVDLKDQGLQLQLRKAALQWVVQDEHGGLCTTLLLQDTAIVTRKEALQNASAKTAAGNTESAQPGVSCSLAQLGFGVAAAKGPVPVACTHLSVQVGILQLTGACQLGILQSSARSIHSKTALPVAAAAAATRAAAKQSVSSRASQACGQQALNALTMALAVLPRKVKVGFSGVRIVPFSAAADCSFTLGQLPTLQGSIGAISLGASVCEQLTATKPGQKLLSATFSIGPMQLAAAGSEEAVAASSMAAVSSPAVQDPAMPAAEERRSSNGLQPAAACSMPGVTAAVDVVHAASSDNRQQQEQRQLHVSCTCKVADALQVQLHPHHFLALAQSVQLLHCSLRALRARQSSAVDAAVAPSTAAREQFQRLGSLSPTLSLSGLPRPETPNLGTPGSMASSPEPAAHIAGAAEAASLISELASPAGQPAAAEPPEAAMRPTEISRHPAAGQSNRATHAGFSSIVLEVGILLNKGVSIEVLSTTADVTAWLELQRIEASGAAQYTPTSSGNNLTAAASVSLQKAAMSVLPTHASSADRQQPQLPAAVSAAMHQLLVLTALEARASSAGSITGASAGEFHSGTAVVHSSQLVTDAGVSAGQLQIALSPTSTAAVLQLLQQCYIPLPQQQTALSGAKQPGSAVLGHSNGTQQVATVGSAKSWPVQLTALAASLQQFNVVYTSNLPTCEGFETAATVQAKAKGLQSRFELTSTAIQVLFQPHQQYLAVAAPLLQLGYAAHGQNKPGLSVELLMLQGVEFSQCVSPQMQLLKTAVQQIQGNMHIDAAVACIGVVDGVVQQMAACTLQLQQKHAANAGTDKQYVSTATVLAATTAGNASTQSDDKPPVQVLPAAMQLPPLPRPANSQQAQQAEPVRSNSPTKVKHKRLLMLELHLQDVAMQASVCDSDVLMLRCELLKYSSMLEQAVLEKLKFSINDRPVVRVPQLAVHQLPGWLPPGAGAAALVQNTGHLGVQVPAAADGTQQYDCSASSESVRGYDSGGAQSWQSTNDDVVPLLSLGSRRPAEAADAGLYDRQAARQQAARERCKVPGAAAISASSSASAGSNGCSSTVPVRGTEQPGCMAATVLDAGTVITLDVYAEQVLLSIPHDEAPGRIILVCETWGKAVKQILSAKIGAIKASIATIQTVTAALNATGSGVAATTTTKKPAPAYLELLVHVQQVVFSLEQHPLEVWMGLHGPVLQAMAAERHLTEQLLASCSTSHGRISRSGTSAMAAAGAPGLDATSIASGGSFAATDSRTKQPARQRRRWGRMVRSRHAPAVAAAAALSAMTARDGPLGQHGVVAAEAVAAGAAATTAAVLDEVQQTATNASTDVSSREASGDGGAESAQEAASFSADTNVGTTHSMRTGTAVIDSDAVAQEVVGSETSEDVDSSDEEPDGHLVADALAAVLPSNASLPASSQQAKEVEAAVSETVQHQQGQQPQHGVQGQPTAGRASSEMQQAVLRAHAELLAMYRSRCRPLFAAAEDPYHPSRSVMHVAAARAEAVVLICLPGHAASEAMAGAVVKRVDPASEGVVMERHQAISLDVGLQEIVAHFGGVEEMASTIGSLGASGLLIRARQLANPPETHTLRMAVGSWHEADVPIVVKGTRPPMKMYTDLKVELDEVQGGFCPGLEAPFGQLNLAFKRLAVPNALNPDGSVPPSTHPGLPWWDMMGYMWRGLASIRLRSLTAIMANTQNPHVGPTDQKMVLTAGTLSMAAAAGRIDLTATNMSAFAHAAAPDAGAGGLLLVLPAFHLPLANLTFHITNKLPNGRNPSHHHAFPILCTKPSPDAPPQQKVDVFNIMRSMGWSLAIDIAVSSDKSPTVGMGASRAGVLHRAGVAGAAGSTAGLLGAAAACWHYYQPYSLPHAFIGEFQINYIIDLVDTFANPTAVVRLARKLKPFYARDRRLEAAAAIKALAAVRGQIVAMPLLKQQVEIALAADVFRVHHDAQDSEDPSDMVYIALSSVRYMNTFTYFRYKRSMQFSNGSRLKDSTRQFMESLSVQAYDLKIVKPQAGGISEAHKSQAAVASRRTSADPKTPTKAGPAAATTTIGPPGCSPLKAGQGSTGRIGWQDAGLGSHLPGFSEGCIAAATCFLLRQAPADPAWPAAGSGKAGVAGSIPIDPPHVPKRAIRMIAQDVKLLCPAELRDTCILLFHHMQKAFSGISFGQPRGPVPVSTKKQQQQHRDGTGSSPRMLRTRLEGSSVPYMVQVGGSAASTLAAGGRVSSDASSTGDGAAGSSKAAGSSASKMVSTPYDEELMLQRILQENRAATAAAEAVHSQLDGIISSAAVSWADNPAGGDHATQSDTAAAGKRSTPATPAAGGAMAKEQLAAAPVGGLEETLLEYEIEFVQVQVNLVSDSARGSLVLGTNSALLLGHLHPARMERSVSFKMDQVQAHVVCSEPDSVQGPVWLEIANGKLNIPAGAESFMRQVLRPFKCQLVTTKQANNSAAAAAFNSASAAGSAQLQLQQMQQGRESNSSGLPAAGFTPSLAQELRLHVPNIAAQLDSRQFEVLMDVIQNIAMAPLPTFPPSVRSLWRHPDGTSEDDDNQDVQHALETLQSLRERQRGLEHELMAVLQAHQQDKQQQQQPFSSPAQRGQWQHQASFDSTSSSWTYSAEQQQPPVYANIKEASSALVGALAAEFNRQLFSGSMGSLALIIEHKTLIWWAQEQLQGASDAIAASRLVLEALRNEAELLKVRQRVSMGVSLTIDTIDWALSKGSSVIVQGELQGILYQSVRGEDHTGTTKIQLRTATFKDPKQQVAADSTRSSSNKSRQASSGQAAAAAAAATLEATSSLRLASTYPVSAGATAGNGGSNIGLVPKQALNGLREQAAAAAASSSSLAVAAEAPDVGIVLAPWNPNESWERDDFVRITAEHGALEKRHVVYEHIEVQVHPIRVHLTAALAAALQDYFKLQDEDSKLAPGAANRAARASGEGSLAKGKKGAGRDDKRRVTAAGDLSLTAAAAAATSIAAATNWGKASSGSGLAGSFMAGSLMAAAAAAPKKPSIFHRRAPAAVAAAAASAAAAAAATAQAAPQAAGASVRVVLGPSIAAQPQIVVPAPDVEIGIYQVENGQVTGVVMPADSPTVEMPHHLPGPSLARVAEQYFSTDTDAAAVTGSDVGCLAGHPATALGAVVLPALPGPCVPLINAEEALLMRYGTVLRARGHAAAGSTPTTPVGSSLGNAALVAMNISSAVGGTPGTATPGGLGPSGAGGAVGVPLTPGAGMAGQMSRRAPQRNIKFKHVRFNRVNARLTYEGPPVSISGFGLVLDKQVYRNIDGGWKTVLNRYKWDAVRSLVKSASGLQARKLQELQIPAFGSEPLDNLELRSSAGLKAGLMLLLKGKKPAGARLRLQDGEIMDGVGGLIGDDDNLREGGVGGGEEEVEGSAGGARVQASDYLDLMRDALRAKHKAKKMALLLGNVPPLPVPTPGDSA